DSPALGGAAIRSPEPRVPRGVVPRPVRGEPGTPGSGVPALLPGCLLVPGTRGDERAVLLRGIPVDRAPPRLVCTSEPVRFPAIQEGAAGLDRTSFSLSVVPASTRRAVSPSRGSGRHGSRAAWERRREMADVVRFGIVGTGMGYDRSRKATT